MTFQIILKISDTFINYDVVKINKHSIYIYKKVSAHGHFYSHVRASARQSPPGLPASTFYKTGVLQRIKIL